MTPLIGITCSNYVLCFHHTLLKVGKKCDMIKGNDRVTCQQFSILIFQYKSLVHLKFYILVRIPSESDIWFRRYRQLFNFKNNVKHKKLSSLLACNSKSIFPTSYSFPLIVSQMLNLGSSFQEMHVGVCGKILDVAFSTLKSCEKVSFLECCFLGTKTFLPAYRSIFLLLLFYQKITTDLNLRFKGLTYWCSLQIGFVGLFCNSLV